MVFFTCTNCGDSVKKNKVEKHYSFKCRLRPVMTCVDCLNDFDSEEYFSHSKCISEEQRYGAGGSGRKPSSSRKERRQEERMRLLTEYVTKRDIIDSTVREILSFFTHMESIPTRKKALYNMLKNHGSFRGIRNQTLDLTWNVLEEINRAIAASGPSASEDEGGEENDYNPQDRVAEPNVGQKYIEEFTGEEEDIPDDDDEEEVKEEYAKEGKEEYAKEEKEEDAKKEKEEDAKKEKEEDAKMEKEEDVKKEKQKKKKGKGKGKPRSFQDNDQEECISGGTYEDGAELKKGDETKSTVSKKEKKEKRKREKYEREIMDIEREANKNLQMDEIEPELADGTSSEKPGKKRKHSQANDGINKENSDLVPNEEAHGSKSERKKKKKQENKLVNKDDVSELDHDKPESRVIETTKSTLKKAKKLLYVSEKVKHEKFNWEENIISALKKKKELSLKRLKKKVLNEYMSFGVGEKSSEKAVAKFNKKVMKIPCIKIKKGVAKLVM